MPSNAKENILIFHGIALSVFQSRGLWARLDNYFFPLCSLPKIVLESPVDFITFLEDLVLKREGYDNLNIVLQLLPPHEQWQHSLFKEDR